MAEDKEKEEKGDSKEKEEKSAEKKKDKSTSVWITVVVIIVIAFAAGYFLNSNREGGITGNIFSNNRGDGGDMIKIGFMGPLTGDAASYGESARRGVELSLKDSGLEDRVEVIFEDSQCEGIEAVNAINKLISIDNVVAIIGEMCSGATIPAAPIAEENQVVLISAASTSPEITNLGDYIFRTVPSDTLQGDFASNLIYHRGYRRLAILYPQEDYGLGLSSVLSERFEALGGAVVASEPFDRGSTDLRTQITKIRSEDPDVLYFISNSPDSVVAGLKQIREQGVGAILFGSEGLKGPDTLEAGSAAQGLTVTSVSVGTESFIINHQNEFGEEPGPFAAQAYDAFSALASTINQGAGTGTEIKDALYGTEFDGASGYIKFDENGDITGNYDTYIIHNGEFVLVE